MWAAFALSAALLTSFNPILYKRMLKDADALLVVWSITLLSLPVLGLFTFGLSRQVPSLDWLFGLGVLGSAVLNVAAQLTSTQALKLADASLVTPLLIFSPVFTVFLSAIFLNETPTARGVVGVGLVLVGAYWLNHESGKDWLTPVRALAFKPGITLILLAGLLWAITPLFEKTAIQHTTPESPEFTALVATTLLVIILTPVVIQRDRAALDRLSLHRREWLLAGLIAGMAPILGYTAFSLGYVGYVTTLFKLGTVMTVIWGSLFLRERGIAHRLPASLVMVAGAILMTL